MAVGSLKAAAIHEAVILLRAGIGAASRRLRLADHVVDGVAALGGETDQDLARGPGVGDLPWRELAELVVRQQHDVNGFRKHHAGRGFVGKLRVPFGTDGLIKGGGAGEIADRKIDEDQLGHEGLPWAGSTEGRTSGYRSDS